MTTKPTPNPRILLMGCGAVGGVLAGGLIHAGHKVEIVTHNPEISKAIAEEGLRLTTPAGLRTLPAAVCADACPGLDAVTGPFDIILLAMKATGVEEAAREIRPLLDPETLVVTLQNGIVEERVRALLDDGHPQSRTSVIGALAGWGATMHAPGIYEMTSEGKTTIGELDGAITDRLQQVRAVLGSAVPTVMTDNIHGALWSKLAINAVVTTLGVVTGQRLGQMLRRAAVRRLALAIISEVLDVAAALDIDLQPVAETLDLHRLYQPPHQRMRRLLPNALSKHLIMVAIGLKFRRIKSSMLQSLERGREPEIAFINGYVVDRAREVDVPVPINAALTEMVKEIAAGERESEPRNLNALL